MPNYTKEQLQEKLDGLKDGETFKAFDQAELDKHIESRIADVTKNKVTPAEERLKTLTTERDGALAKLQAIQSEADKKNKTEGELLTAEITKRDETIEALRQKYAESEATIQTVAKDRRTEYKTNRLLALFSSEAAKAANPATAVREALTLAGNVLELEENGNGMQLKAVDDPTLKNPIPLEDWGKAFLDKNPHLKAATGSGAPVGAGKPKGDQTTDPMAGLSIGQRMQKATREKYADRQRK